MGIVSPGLSDRIMGRQGALQRSKSLGARSSCLAPFHVQHGRFVNTVQTRLSQTLTSKALFRCTGSEENPDNNGAWGGVFETRAFCSEAEENARRDVSKKHETLTYNHSMYLDQPAPWESVSK